MPHTLYTAGYTGVSPDDLFNATVLLNAVLVDIRYSPWSRNPDWIQAAMEDRFADRYFYVKELGNVNYNKPEEGIRLYDVETGLRRVALIIKKFPVILLCACKQHDTCHRRVAAEEMQQRYSLEVVHLTGDAIYKLCHPKPEQRNLF